MKHFCAAVAGFTLVVGSALSQSSAKIHVDGSDFKDDQGRTLILRGVNLGGNSKIPAHTSSDPRAVSFVGRPFPLAQADEHFRRLQSWGLTVERLIVPWEAIEHAGPGMYDQAYLDYLAQLVQKANTYGIRVVIDLHQDFYSRASGGDGAPYWTLTMLGLSPDHTNEPGAPQKQPPRGPGYWPPTAARFSVDTMDTLLFAGDDFAPGLKVEGVPVQSWLQGHYIAAMQQVAKRLQGMSNVIGYDTYNEPQPGLIDVRDLQSKETFMLVIGHYASPSSPTPTYWDLMQAASGFAPSDGSVPANLLWASGKRDIWREYGVWDVVNGTPTLLKPDYFKLANGKTHSLNYYLGNFYRKIAQGVHEIDPAALIMQEASGMIGNPKEFMIDSPLAVIEPHFYDDASMLSKHQEFDSTRPLMADKAVTGKAAVAAVYLNEAKGLKSEGKLLGGIPVWFGETGIPYDLNDKYAYKSGDFSVQNEFAELLYDALDKTLSSYAIWCYSSDNNNQTGDHWNHEDYSIFSPDQVTNHKDINSGGRALNEVVRPYPIATAGAPETLSFDPATKTFHYVFKADRNITAKTELFLPHFQYPRGVNVTITGGTYTLFPSQSRMEVTATEDEVTISITPKT